MPTKCRIAVLVSGGGTNLQALIDAQGRDEIPHGHIALVISNKADAYALTRAEQAGIPAVTITKAPCGSQEDFEEALLAQLAAYGREHSLYRITLEVRVGNAPARTLYEREEYKLDGIRPMFYSQPTEDAAIYSLYF